MVKPTKSPTDKKYKPEKEKPNAPTTNPGPIVPNGAPKEVPGIYNDRLPLPEDPNAQAPKPPPGQPLSE